MSSIKRQHDCSLDKTLRFWGFRLHHSSSGCSEGPRNNWMGMGVDGLSQVRKHGLWKTMKMHIDIIHCKNTRWGRENMDFDLKEQIFDPTMSVVTRTSTARVPEGARPAPHSSQFSSTDWQIIGKTNANTDNTNFKKTRWYTNRNKKVQVQIQKRC